jgi:hypothetical protein
MKEGSSMLVDVICKVYTDEGRHDIWPTQLVRPFFGESVVSSCGLVYRIARITHVMIVKNKYSDNRTEVPGLELELVP